MISDFANNALAALIQFEDLDRHLSIPTRATVLGGVFAEPPSTRMLLTTSKKVNRQMTHLETLKNRSISQRIHNENFRKIVVGRG
jgi:hypothetical protein